MSLTPVIAFIEVCTVDRDGYRGAALVVDPSGDPVEFRCTSPVRPTKLQKLLWGKRLTQHLLVHVLGRPLVDALSTLPALLVVRQRLLLGLRPVAGLPTVQLLATAEDAGCRSLGADPPAFLRAYGDRADDLDLAARHLAPVGRGLPATEPFTRVLQAVAELHREEATVEAV